MSRRNLIAFSACFAFLATIYCANAATDRWGPIPVGLGLMAPAGVLFAGLAFSLRDLVHEFAGRAGALIVICWGAFLSLITVDDRLALASALAFLVSELLDLMIYDRLRRRSYWQAVALSNTAGAILDSCIFLSVAFGSLEFLPGQILAKSYMTLLALVLLSLARRRYALLPWHARA